MKITITPIEGRDKFDVALSSKEGAEPFLTIRGCRVVDGQKGKFISYPAQKMTESGKWWNHVRGSDAFNAAVLAEAMKARPAPAAMVDDDAPPF